MLSCQQPSGYDIIPRPVSIQPEETAFELSADTRIYFPKGQPEWELAVQYFMALAQTSTGFQLTAQPLQREVMKPRRDAIYFLHDKKILQPEGYVLDINSGNITIRAQTAAGAFYAVQTLRQLFPPAFSAETQQSDVRWVAKGCRVEDFPRFAYRGMHLDVGRHFFPVSFVKRYIDLIALHKFNRFHWHLTDDQGWRIEIKKYPRLQSIAACRKETLLGHYSDSPQKFDGKSYCAYYTQEEVQEIVEYARSRFVTIVPEIEMPGHALAALSAYPELGCTGGPYEAGTLWGVFDDVFCAGNEKTFEFIEGVLTEVCALFPGDYVHAGGDECPKTRWKTCPKCQARMKTEGLKDEHELQSYFIRRAVQMLAKHNKKLIGWDEILEGGLAPSATVMSWRGIEGGIAAAKAGHDAIMTPGSHCYFDYYQGDPSSEPVAIGGYTTLEKTYSYEPIPGDLSAEEARHIIGAQGNIWTEYIESPEYLEYMVFPRACALAEVVWAPPGARAWSDFSRRIRAHFKLLDVLGVNYAKSYFDVKSAFANGKVSLQSADPAIEIRFTTDGKDPDAQAPRYMTPFELTKTTTLKAVAFSGEKKLGKVLTIKYLMHKATGRPYTLSKQPEQYAGGETYALTNGETGNSKTWNKWVGLVNRDIDPVIDLGASTDVYRVSTHFVNSKLSWIYPPRSIEVLVSDDGVSFKPAGRKEIDAAGMTGISVETVIIDTKARGRYVKLVAQTFGVIPPGAPGESNGAWLFLDEVVVE